MRKPQYWISALLLAAATGGILSACRPKNDQARILELIDRIGSLVEDKDTSGLLSLLDEGYKDFKNRGKKETEAMVREYFREYRGIVLHLLGTRIDEIRAGEASVQTELVLSSGAAEVFRKLFRAFGDFYRFDLKFYKMGMEWRISYAKWENIGFTDLSPESLALLKKIFPGI